MIGLQITKNHSLDNLLIEYCLKLCHRNKKLILEEEVRLHLVEQDLILYNKITQQKKSALGLLHANKETNKPLNVCRRCRMTQLNINQNLLEHKILLNLQNQFKKNLCSCKGGDNKAVHCKEHKDHNNNLEEDQEQVHQIINNKHKENLLKIEFIPVRLIGEMQLKEKSKGCIKSMELIDIRISY